jgi:hypothetical protein
MLYEILKKYATLYHFKYSTQILYGNIILSIVET